MMGFQVTSSPSINWLFSSNVPWKNNWFSKGSALRYCSFQNLWSPHPAYFFLPIFVLVSWFFSKTFFGLCRHTLTSSWTHLRTYQIGSVAWIKTNSSPRFSSDPCSICFRFTRTLVNRNSSYEQPFVPLVLILGYLFRVKRRRSPSTLKVSWFGWCSGWHT